MVCHYHFWQVDALALVTVEVVEYCLQHVLTQRVSLVQLFIRSWVCEFLLFVYRVLCRFSFYNQVLA